jgi:four helix bundle protein
MPYRSFEELEVWKRACRLAVKIYEVLRECRDFGLKDQMTRAAVSVASNIAEGAERGSPAEFVRFLHIAKGSAAELRTQLYIASEINLINNEDEKLLIQEIRRISAMLHSLIKCVQNQHLKPGSSS